MPICPPVLPGISVPCTPGCCVNHNGVIVEADGEPSPMQSTGSGNNFIDLLRAAAHIGETATVRDGLVIAGLLDTMRRQHPFGPHSLTGNLLQSLCTDFGNPGLPCVPYGIDPGAGVEVLSCGGGLCPVNVPGGLGDVPPACKVFEDLSTDIATEFTSGLLQFQPLSIACTVYPESCVIMPRSKRSYRVRSWFRTPYNDSIVPCNWYAAVEFAGSAIRGVNYVDVAKELNPNLGLGLPYGSMSFLDSRPRWTMGRMGSQTCLSGYCTCATDGAVCVGVTPDVLASIRNRFVAADAMHVNALSALGQVDQAVRGIAGYGFTNLWPLIARAAWYAPAQGDEQRIWTQHGPSAWPVVPMAATPWHLWLVYEGPGLTPEFSALLGCAP